MKNSKEILIVLLALHMGFVKAKEDGKLDMNDIAHFTGPLIQLPAAIQDANLVLKEMKEATNEERAALHAELALMYDIPDDAIEAKVEGAVKFLMACGEFAGVILV